MKGKLLSLSASLVASAADISVKPMCLIFFHQPKVPVKLIKK